MDLADQVGGLWPLMGAEPCACLDGGRTVCTACLPAGTGWRRAWFTCRVVCAQPMVVATVLAVTSPQRLVCLFVPVAWCSSSDLT